MEDQLISFETAKLAKEKGFDERCRHIFTAECEGTAEELEYYEGNGSNSEINNGYGYYSSTPVCSSPTQSLLQRWLREQHNLHIEVKVQDFIETPKYYWSIFGSYRDSKMIRCLVNGKHEDYITYEVALEGALIEALKRINNG